MKLSSYCSHDLKMIIFKSEVMLSWFLSELWPFSNFLIVSLVSATPLAVFSGFYDTFQLLFPWPEEDHIKSRSPPDCFLPELWPFAIYKNWKKTCQHNILITTWARILIFGIWLRINIYMTLTTLKNSMKHWVTYASFTTLLITIEFCVKNIF